MGDFITVSKPPETYSMGNDHEKDPNYRLVVVFDEDTTKFLKTDRIHIFESLQRMKDYFKSKNWRYDLSLNNDIVIFKTRGFDEYFATVFWGYNHENNRKVSSDPTDLTSGLIGAGY